MKPEVKPTMTEEEFIAEISLRLSSFKQGQVVITEILFSRERWLSTSNAEHIAFGNMLAKLVYEVRLNLEFAPGKEAVQRYIVKH